VHWSIQRKAQYFLLILLDFKKSLGLDAKAVSVVWGSPRSTGGRGVDNRWKAF
jgi:hypothetical protein